MKSFTEFLTEGKKVGPAGKDYEKNYKGFDPTVDHDGKEGHHVYEFPNHKEKQSFLDKVGGAPHPLGGHRVILNESTQK